jgi:hypothetical protein
VLQLPLTLPGMGAGIVGEKVAMLPPLLAVALTFPLLLLRSLMGLPLSPPPQAAKRRNAPAAAISRNAALRFMPEFW